MAGLVGVDDVVAEYVTAPLEEIFARAFDDQAYDITELSFSNYLYITSTGNCPYIGLPVFPSRSFRHSAIFIRTDRGIRGPRDLAGRIVGVRESRVANVRTASGATSSACKIEARGMVPAEATAPASAVGAL